MLRPRIIPCLLVRDKGLVKTVGFSESKYIGDPINAVKIFNEKGVDELIVLDIDATVRGYEPDYPMIEHMAAESRMPLCYGGGVHRVEQAKTIIGLGVEKVAISAAAVNTPNFINQIAEIIGVQSIVVVLDVKKNIKGSYEVWTHNGSINTGRSPRDFIISLKNYPCGEIVLNSIDHDGMMKGYDLALIEEIFDIVTVPLTILGGAGSNKDIEALITRFGLIGAAAGSLFVFKGPYRAVLINYPSIIERDELMFDYLKRLELAS